MTESVLTTQTTSQTPAQGQANANGTASTAGSQGDWRASLPDDVKSDPSLATFSDIGALAKSWVSAQKMVGAEKIAVPGKNATPDDWKNHVWTKLGLPKDFKDYKVESPKGIEFHDELLNGFKDVAYKAGVLPHQAQAILEHYAQATQKLVTDNEKTELAEQSKALDGLKREWGNAYEGKVRQAQMALEVLAGDSFEEVRGYFEESGLGNDPVVIKLLAKAGEAYKESELVGKTKGALGKTPAEIEAQIGAIMGNSTSPYWNKDHINHNREVEEVMALRKQLVALANPA